MPRGAPRRLGRLLRTWIAPLLLGTAVAAPIAAQEDASTARACSASAEKLGAAVRDVHDRQRNVGVAAAVGLDDELAFETYVGMADLEHRVPVGPETRFGIASVTKLFTAIALLQAEAEGRLALDDPARRHVPDFPARDGGPITLAMLATHRSGLPHPRDRTPELFATHYATATDAVEVFRGVELVAPPGTERTYSSSNYNLIAAAIEGASGRRFHDVVAGGILDPLGLAATGFDDVRAVLPHRARRYSFYDPWTYEESATLQRVPTWDYSFNPGGGNMVSTARDLIIFGHALLEPGRVLGEPQTGTLFDEGWFGRRTESGELFLLVTGANPGVQAGFAIFPDRRATAVVLANAWGVGSNSAEMVALARVLVDLCAPAGESSR